MRSIDERLKFEEEMIVLLLLIFASQDLAWFLRPFGPSRRWFERQIARQEIPDLARRIAEQAQREMLEDLELELASDNRIRSQLNGFEDRFMRDLAGSLSRTHENWVEAYDRKRRRQETLPELYPNWKANRDAATKITEAISYSQERTHRALENFFGIKLIAQWKLDPFSNWCELCLSLADQFQAQWWRIFPGYPPAHPNCRCGVKYTHWLGENVVLPSQIDSGRRTVELLPQREMDPFARRLRRDEGIFRRVLTTL